MALARARLEGCAVVLASATPSLEIGGRRRASSRGGPPAEPGWRHVALPARHGGAAMPEVRLVDLRRDRPPRGGFLSPPLREALCRNLGRAPSRCCSSTAAATPRSPCAAPAATASPARTARPGSCPTACAAGCSATIAATPCRAGALPELRCRRAADRLRARASSGWPRSWREILPKARLAVMTSDTAGDAKAATALVEAMERHASTS